MSFLGFGKKSNNDEEECESEPQKTKVTIKLKLIKKVVTHSEYASPHWFLLFLDEDSNDIQLESRYLFANFEEGDTCDIEFEVDDVNDSYSSKNILSVNGITAKENRYKFLP